MVICSQAYNMVFLLHIGHIGLKCPSLAYKVLIGLKMTNYYQNHPFLISFCFTLKTYFAMIHIGEGDKGGRSGNASCRAIPDPFFDAESKNDVRFGPQTSIGKARPLLWAKKEVFFAIFCCFCCFGPFLQQE